MLGIARLDRRALRRAGTCEAPELGLFGILGFDLPQSGTGVRAAHGDRELAASGAIVTLIAFVLPGATRDSRGRPSPLFARAPSSPPSRVGERFGPAVAIALAARGPCGAGLRLPGKAPPDGEAACSRSGAHGVLAPLHRRRAVSAKQVVAAARRGCSAAPGARSAGIAGRLARENATRNPERTASTAAALMIGLALVTFVATLGGRTSRPFFDAVDKLWSTDYAITAENDYSPIPIAVEKPIHDVSGVKQVIGVRLGEVQVYGKRRTLTGVAPGASTVFRLDWADGSQQVMDTLGPDGSVRGQGLREGSRAPSRLCGSSPDSGGRSSDLHGGGDLRAADRRVALWPRDDLQRALRPALLPARGSLRLRDHAGRRHALHHGGARPGARELPQCQGAGSAAVQGQPDQRAQQPRSTSSTCCSSTRSSSACSASSTRSS